MAKLTDLPEKAEVVIIGGGIIGCSIAYHLTKRGHERCRFTRTQTANLRDHMACSGASQYAVANPYSDGTRQVQS